MPRGTSRKHLTEEASLVFLEGALTAAVRERKLRALLRGLLTHGQRTELAQRFRIAWYLRAGWSFRGIAAATGASTTTIGAVDRFLRSVAPHYRPVFPLPHRRRPARTQPGIIVDPLRNRNVFLSGKWLFRELTGREF